MKCDIRTIKVKLTKGIKDHLEDKISKLDKYFSESDSIEAKIVLKVVREDQTVEVTIPTKNFLLRAEETNHDLYSAIDLVLDKLEAQIRKNKERIKVKISKEKINDLIIDFESEKEEANKVVKTKQIEMKPMDIEEAILEMNLLGHNFFMFKNRINDKICVLYKRKDNNYGVIEAR